MAHPRVDRLRFARAEWVRGLRVEPILDAVASGLPASTPPLKDIGEASAVRQILGHERLAQFVGAIEDQAPYRREDG